MGQVNTVDARAQFSEIINRAAFAKERVTLTRRGKEIVAVVPIEDVKLLEALEDKIDLEEAREALSEAKRKGTKSWDRIKKDLGIWLASRMEFAPRAERDFRALDGSLRKRIARRIDALAQNPYPAGIKKLAGDEQIYRLRVRDYRTLYQVKGRALLIVGIGQRREFYQRIVS
jgi:prevent-host-death family protein